MSTMRTAKQNLRSIVVELFPWLPGVVAVASAKGKGLAIRTASGLLHLAGGPDDPAVHRVGDRGTAGAFTTGGAGVLVYTGPDGTAWTITFTSATPGSPVVIAILPGEVGTPGALTTQATTGSEKVTSA